VRWELDLLGLSKLTFFLLARISVMGGEQAAGVLAQITRDAKAKRGESWPEGDELAFKKPIQERYEAEGHPYFAR
jgi:3-methylcrotonyl-CoA carboxylase beta subunit